MTEIIKAPSLLEATRYNNKIVELDRENTDAFCEDVVKQINAHIKRNNWFLNPAPTVEIKWDWWRENWKGKMSQQGIYKYAIPILKQKIEDAGYSLFYSGGGDRVAYFTMRPKELEKQQGLCLSE
jgi:hypothetical protein